MSDKNLVDRTDEELFDLYKESADDKYFSVIYNRYAKKVFTYCLRAMQDRDSAKDIFQKSWTAVIEKKDDFSAGCFIAWLMVITRNFCLMEKRTHKYSDEIYENTLVSDSDTNHDFALKEILINKINKLPEDMAEIIRLKYFDEFSYKEIADILNINMSLVKVRLFRAKKLLADNLTFLKENEL